MRRNFDNFITLTLCVGLAGALASAREAQLANDGSQGRSMVPQYMEYARKLLDSTLHEAKQSAGAQIPVDDARRAQMLRESIVKATELISAYQTGGLSNMPSLPNIPGVNTMMRTPDKILRAELSMLQDLIRMAASMIQNPIAATINVPKDVALMMSRIADQVEQ